MRSTLLALFLFFVTTTAFAADTWRVGIDLDPGAAGGCDFDLMGVEANATDMDLMLELTIDPGPVPTVLDSKLHTCNAGLNVFENPVSVGPAPWPVGEVVVPNPDGVGHVIEAIVPESFLAGASQAQLVVLAEAEGGSLDVLSTVDGTPTAAPIIVSLARSVPSLSPISLGIVVLSLLAIGWLLSKRWGKLTSVVLILGLIASAPGVAYALVITLDGLVADWGTTSPMASDSNSDSTLAGLEAEIVDLFATQGGGNLSLRFDALAPDPGPCDGFWLSVEQENVSIPGLLSFDTRTVSDETSSVSGLTGPTLEIAAGATTCITLTNNLDSGATQATCPFHSNSFHCADQTSLYLQGGYLSTPDTPVGPGETLVYPISVPPDYPPGLALYRAGLHGSSALQVGGGLAGLIDVKNENVTLPADLAALYDAPDHLPLLLQHLWFSASDGGGGAFALDSHPAIVASYGAENPISLNVTGANPTAHVVVVNGELAPTLSHEVEDAMLLRFASASTTRIVELELVDPNDYCEIRLLARDGIFHQDSYLTIDSIVLLPQSRADVAIRCEGSAANSTISFAAVPAPLHDADLGVSNRHSQAVVLDLALLPSTGLGRPLPTSFATLPAYLDDLQSVAVSQPLNSSGGFVGSIAAGPGTGPGSKGISGVSFQGYDVPETSRYTFITCVGQSYELQVGQSPSSGVGHLVSFSGFHVQVQSSDSSSEEVYRAGEWRDVIPQRGFVVRFTPRDHPLVNEYQIGGTVLEHRDQGELGLVRVVQSTEPRTGVAAVCP
ncbi:MAG: hypothetical protein ACI8W3_001330 [Myxococcota bacterium]|jgi:hypothetical protein